MKTILIYKEEECIAFFPKHARFFKLTRRFYPNRLIEIIYNGNKIKVPTRDLKSICEVRSGKFSSHHIKAKSAGGSTIESNLLTLDISRHNAYHLLFGNMDLNQVILLLQRLQQIKKYQKMSIKL